MPRDMKMLRVVVGVLCVAIGLSAVALGTGAVVAGPNPKWPLFGMEVVTLVASLVGVGMAMGRMKGAPALGLACVAGSIFVAAVLGYVGSNKQLELAEGKGAIALRPLLLARLASVCVIACVAMYANLRRDGVATRTFWKGVAWALPLVLMGGAYVALRSRVGGMGEGALLAVACAAGLVGMISLSGAGHCFIRAFEMGASKNDELGSASA